jgi:hypothetical protein
MRIRIGPPYALTSTQERTSTCTGPDQRRRIVWSVETIGIQEERDRQRPTASDDSSVARGRLFENAVPTGIRPGDVYSRRGFYRRFGGTCRTVDAAASRRLLGTVGEFLRRSAPAARTEARRSGTGTTRGRRHRGVDRIRTRRTQGRLGAFGVGRSLTQPAPRLS